MIGTRSSECRSLPGTVKWYMWRRSFLNSNFSSKCCLYLPLARPGGKPYEAVDSLASPALLAQWHKRQKHVAVMTPLKYCCSNSSMNSLPALCCSVSPSSSESAFHSSPRSNSWLSHDWRFMLRTTHLMTAGVNGLVFCREV